MPLSPFSSQTMTTSQLLSSLQSGLSGISNSLFPRVPTSPLEDPGARPTHRPGATNPVVSTSSNILQSSLISPPHQSFRGTPTSRHSILDRLSSLEQTLASAHQPQTQLYEGRVNSAPSSSAPPHTFRQNSAGSSSSSPHPVLGSRFNFPSTSVRAESAIRGSGSPSIATFDDHGALNLSARSSSADSGSKDSPMTTEPPKPAATE